MNSFEKHGIEHLSASTLNLFSNCLGVFIIEKLFKQRGGVGAAAHRGTAAEAGIVMGLMNPDAKLEDCQAFADKEFNRLSALSADPNREKEGKAVAGIVEQGLIALRPYGIPTHTQRKIELRIDELPIPIIGYTDIEWEDKGVLVDIKTQLRLSSEISEPHARQVSIYKGAISDNLDARIAYITPQKSAVYALENHRDHLKAVVNIAKTMERFLALSSDPKELAGLVAPDFSSFYFNNPDIRRAGFNIWGY